ncbi:MAG: class I SAM-dependent methyltransferase [Proteobacteria bacterium]|nr:class I SAM-dependent methyltransferase [Pseudomonadota bacterium]
MSTDPVRVHYEAYPYPPRDPREERRRLVTGSPSRLAELNHYVFGGRLDLRRPFRALVAGGGTGDGTIMLAQQLADARAQHAEIVYLDLSATARKTAEARAAARGLASIRFVTGSLLELSSLGLGPFDYVDCCGVLHHLGDPAAGLAILRDALSPHGGIGLMLYGPLGRTGVYPAQEMLATLVGDADDPPARVALARRLLAQLPPTNWLRRNPFIADHLTQGDSGIYDVLLHARDRAFAVPEIAALIAGASLRLQSFVPAARYEPTHYLSDATLLKRLAGLSAIDRAAFAERLAGNMKSHVFYAVRATNATLPATADRLDAVPILCEFDGAAIARGTGPGGILTGDADGIKLRFPLPPLAAAMAGLIDGRRTLGDIHAALAAKSPTLKSAGFMEQFARLYAALNGLGKLFIAYPAAAAAG